MEAVEIVKISSSQRRFSKERTTPPFRKARRTWCWRWRWRWLKHRRCRASAAQIHNSFHQQKAVQFKNIKDAEGESGDKDDITTAEQPFWFPQVRCRGFPNPAQICYMNSTLQSLLTLQDFFRDISRQEDIWRSSPNATLYRALMDIREFHNSSNILLKIQLLLRFKQTVSDSAPEFSDLQQKDAHEFLTSVLAQMRGLGPSLQTAAANIGQSFSCPVEEHLVFKMESTRTCKSCGSESSRQEDFTSLSLDLVPLGGTVEQMLQDYLKEKPLEFTCKCGGDVSSLRLTFSTLPRVLVLHLKRFRFTSSNQLMKLHDNVSILRNLDVPSNQGSASYNLVSIINHMGCTTTSGHYISDGINAERQLNNRWLTYDDALVFESRGSRVVRQRQHTAYILFLKRQRKFKHHIERRSKVHPSIIYHSS